MTATDDANRDASAVSGAAAGAQSQSIASGSALGRRRKALAPHLPSAVPGLVVAGLILLWAADNGGYDPGTWYWGALLIVGLLAVTTLVFSPPVGARRRVVVVSVGAFAVYVAWSFASLLWARDAGTALEGSDRALLYLALFVLMVSLPWTAEAGLAVLVTLAVGIGAIGVVLVFRLASSDHVASLLAAGRMNSPTGYYNATAALFTIDALLCCALASRRELPALLRGLLLALTVGDLQLAIAGQSRGWLFTLPLVLLAALVVAPARLRVTATAVIPVVAALALTRPTLKIYDVVYTARLNDVAAHAGQIALVLMAVTFVIGTLLAWVDVLWRRPPLSRRWRRVIGSVACVAAVAAGVAGALVVSHGRPLHFASDQWRGFSHPQQASTGSHFGDVGSSRYDFWRVALDAFSAHPIGGLGQDNFADYYVVHRHSYEEPSWTHSIELRLLAHTGIVGFLSFAAFIVCALIAAAGVRRRGPPLHRVVAGIALLPVVVWLIHGSLDWFWEMPALSGLALGMLGLAIGLGRPAPDPSRSPARRRPARLAVTAAGGVAFLAAIVVLAFPYLAVREEAIGNDIQAQNTSAALRAFARAADLNPLSATPGRLAGGVALSAGDYRTAAARFAESRRRDPGGWFAWLGSGLAASAMGDRAAARRYYTVAHAIDSQQPAVRQALARVDSRHPLTSEQAFKLLVIQ